VNKIPYFETKVVKVKNERECPHFLIRWIPEKEMHKCCRCGRYVETDEHRNAKKKQPKGNWVNGECIDKIKFPCLCSYIVVLTGEKRYGKLDKGWDDIAYKNNYIISNIEKQTTDMSILYVDTSLKKLMINLKIKILKGKIIIFEEGK